MIDGAARIAFLRMFSSALASQVVLSATSFLVGLLLIRRSSDLQYGYYILVSGGIILACSLQNAFIAPTMIHRMTRLSRVQCGDLTGGLYREQRQLIAAAAGIALILTLSLWIAGLIGYSLMLLGLGAILATTAALRREFFRMVLLAYRRAHEVLRGDSVYALLLGVGVLLATFTPLPAAASILAAALAALAAGALLSRGLRRQESWNLQGEPGVLRQIAPLGAWSTAGAAIHWSFSQGYTVLIAATLDVGAVAAVAATRLLVMPVNLLSSGIGSLMLPLAARWLHDSGAPLVLRRLLAFALVIATLSLCYLGLLWLLRDWVFEVLLNKQFAQRDLLLLLWSASFVLMAVNQQLLWLLIARARFRQLTALGLASAAVALISSYWAMQSMGGVGAPLGILIGESIHTVGIVILSLREARPEMLIPQFD
jgi:O-antigen/teichoic acid export membrane protein